MFKVSIIIPHYNCPKLLANLLDTIPQRKEIQTIVVDDNSSKEVEQYVEVVNKYSERVEFYKNDSGIQSAGTCRNIGLDHAKGEWIIFADSDDFFLPQMYSCISKYFETDNDMVIFSPTSIFIDTREVADRHVLHQDRINKYLSNPTHKNLLNAKKMKEPWSKMIRLSVIADNKIRFSETLHINDMYFSTKASYYCKKTVVSSEEIYCITRNQGSLTTKTTKKSYDFHVQEFIKCYMFAKEKYNKEDFEALNMSGGFLIFEAYKRNLGIKVIIQSLKEFREQGIPLLSKELKNPLRLAKVILFNNKMVKKEKKYYVEK